MDLDQDPELGKFKAGFGSGINHFGSATLLLGEGNRGHQDPMKRGEGQHSQQHAKTSDSQQFESQPTQPDLVLNNV